MVSIEDVFGADEPTAEGLRAHIAGLHARTGGKLGFKTEDREEAFKDRRDLVMNEVKRTLSPEFINRIDEIILWLKGVLDSIPFYLFVAAVAFALAGNPYAMHIAMVSTFWTTTGRLVRGEVIKLKNFEFVEAARAIGVPQLVIIYRHILPNTFHILLVQATIVFVAAIKSEVILSFLGLGVQDGVSWGLMIDESTQEVLAGFFNNFVWASVFLFGLVMAFNMFSDALQDALDPKKVAA